MLATFLLLSLLAAPAGAASPAAACSGADPAIVKTALQSSTQNGPLRHLVVAITVSNLSDVKQASNVLQSVAVYQDGNKVDNKGVKPLAAHQLQTVTYTFDRSAQAAPGTTHLRFKLSLEGATPANADCNTENDEARLNV